MYAVIHGGVDKDLRLESCQFLSQHDFDGFAIGGSMGKTKAEMHEMLSFTLPHIPKDKPNHLLGIGEEKLTKLHHYEKDPRVLAKAAVTMFR